MEVTDEQRDAIASLPSLARRVVLERIADPRASDVECYRRAGGGAKSESAARNSVHLILTNPNTVKVLAMFKTEELDEAVVNRDEILRDLSMISRVKLSDIMTWYTPKGDLIDGDTGQVLPFPSVITIRNMDEMSDELERCVKSIKQTRYGIELTLHDAMTARKLIIDMQGLNAPIKTINAEINAENVSDDEFLEGLTAFGLK